MVLCYLGEFAAGVPSDFHKFKIFIIYFGNISHTFEAKQLLRSLTFMTEEKQISSKHHREASHCCRLRKATTCTLDASIRYIAIH